MSNTRRWYQAVLTALLLVFVVAAWLVFAPLQLGGHSAYIIVTGNSMEPGFHLGELVIVQPQLDYQVGDIVVYRNPQLKAYVFHRIIRIDHDRFILKGDNNSWKDSYQPPRDDVVGKLWIHIPALGKAVQWLRLPKNLALMAGATGGILMAVILMGNSSQRKGKSKQSRSERSTMDKKTFTNFLTNIGHWAPFKSLRAKRYRGKNLIPKGPAPLQNRDTRNRSGLIEGLFFVLGLVAFASLALGFFAFNRPTWRTVTDDIDYLQSGAFSYAAVVPPGVFDSGLLISGEPVFTNLTCILNLRFDYKLTGEDLQDLTGSYQFSAQVLDATSGWNRTIPLEPKTPFSGNSLLSRSTINLCQVERLVATMEEMTGFRAPYYTLVLTPLVSVTGKMSGRDLQAGFEPELVFQFDTVHFFITPADPQSGDPLKPSETGTLAGFRTIPNTLPLLGKELLVSDLRTATMVGFGVSLVGILLLIAYIIVTSRRSQVTFLQMKYSSMLVDLQDKPFELTTPVIDVVSMEALAKLAERLGAVILHQERDSIHHFFVQGDRISYRFVVDESGGDVSDRSVNQQPGEPLVKKDSKNPERQKPSRKRPRSREAGG